MHKGWTDVISKETNQPIARIYCADTVRSHNPTPAHHILLDAFALHREVVRLRGILDYIKVANLDYIKDIDMDWGIDFNGASITVTHSTGIMLTGKLEVVR